MRELSIGRRPLLLAVAWGLFFSLGLVAPARAKSERYTFIISDTHFGVGHNKSGFWDAYEDARWPADLASFLAYVSQAGGGKADLIINGDIFELWQSRDVSCKYSDKDAGCSDADALRRLQRVLGAHASEVGMLKAFASNDENKLTLVVGNHDVALLLPRVKAELIRTFACSNCNFLFEESGVWQSADGKVRAEHGHQIGEDPNAFAGWPKPFIQLNGATHVRRPWGEQFVQEFYNQFEAKYPIIDNVTDELKAMRLGLRAEGVAGSGKGALEFVKFLALHESWAQADQILGEDGSPGSAWNVNDERAKGAAFLQQSFSDGDEAQALIKGVRAADADAFVRDPTRLTDADIREICDARSSRKQGGAKVTVCSHALGNLINSAVTHRTEIFRSYLGAMARVPRVFVYSHTHQAERFSITQPDVDVLNTGAWQRLISPDEIEAKAKAAGKKPEEMLRQLLPDDLEACYTFVAIPPYSTNFPKAELRSWQIDQANPQGKSSLTLCN